MRDRRSIRVLAGVLVAVLACGGGGLATLHHRARPTAGLVGVGPAADLAGRSTGTLRRSSPWPRPGRVAVPVADIWDRADSARPVDVAATGPSPDMAGWLAGLDLAQRLDLDYRLATQALLDDPLVVLAESGLWARVRLTGQRGTAWPRGIEGWMPAAQISYQEPVTAPEVTVSVPHLAAGGLELSYGTRLPVLVAASGRFTVYTPSGPAAVPADAVRSQPLPPSGSAVVAQAERFLGLPYLWAGTSSYGFDCSGLTLMVYRQFGIELPRDAADQQAAGIPVGRDALQPGDLVFYSFDAVVDHVGIYAGAGRMVDSPETGGSIENVPMWGTPLSTHFAGAARYFRVA